MVKRKLPEALKAHQFKKGGKKGATKAKGKKVALAGGVRSAMPGLVNPGGTRVVRA